MAIVKLSNRGVKDITAVGSIGTGDLVFISKQTASSSASISFTSGIDSTYKEYIFFFNNIHPATSNVQFQVGFRDGATDYDAVKTTTIFRAFHNESGSTTSLEYATASDLAQSTDFQTLGNAIGNENDECCSGYLHLFNPSSTTFVKHFTARANLYHPSNFTVDEFIAGYCNTTTAIDALQFKFSSGNIDSGDILLYGVN